MTVVLNRVYYSNAPSTWFASKGAYDEYEEWTLDTELLKKFLVSKNLEMEEKLEIDLNEYFEFIK